MNPIRNAPAALTLALALALAFSACNESNPGVVIEPEPEKDFGSIHHGDGTPASGAKVRIYKVDDLPLPGAAGKVSAAVLIANTDAQGRYSIKGLANGEYNILAESGGRFSYRDSVTLGPVTGSTPSDTLAAPGIVRGRIDIDPQHDPRAFTIQLLGTNRFAALDGNGGFEFRDLAPGTYSVRITTSFNEYTPSYTSLVSAAGKETELSSPLSILFTGVPTVRGLRAQYDTANGVARISWNLPAYQDLSEFLVFRDLSANATLSQKPVFRTPDTSWIDTLFSKDLPVAREWPFDSDSAAFRYRVMVVSKGEKSGPFRGYAEVRAVSPARVRTETGLLRIDSVTVELDHKKAVAITIGDTLRLGLEYRNPIRRIRSVEWLALDGIHPLQTHHPDSSAGIDTFAFVAGRSPSVSSLRVRAIDESGTSVETPITIRIVDDKPEVVPFAARESAKMGDTVRILSVAKDLGRIVSWEWDFGSTGTYVGVPHGDSIVLRTPSTFPAGGRFISRVRVTDDDGNKATGEVGLTILPWQGAAALPFPVADAAAAVHGGKIYVVGGTSETTRRNLLVYDPALDKWEQKAPLPTPRTGATLVSLGDKLYLYGGTNPSSTSTDVVKEFMAYVPDEDKWVGLPDFPIRSIHGGGMGLGHKLYFFTGQGTMYENPYHMVSVFDLNTNSWDSEWWGTPYVYNQPMWGYAWATVGVNFYAIGGFGGQSSGWDYWNGTTKAAKGIKEFSVVDKSTTELFNTYPLGRLYSAGAAVDGRIYITGGSGHKHSGSVVAYDPGPHDWYLKSPMPSSRSGHASVALDGKVYLIGGREDLFGEITSSVDVYLPAQDAQSVLLN